jgi:hypothetical protein
VIAVNVKIRASVARESMVHNDESATIVVRASRLISARFRGCRPPEYLRATTVAYKNRMRPKTREILPNASVPEIDSTTVDAE